MALLLLQHNVYPGIYIWNRYALKQSYGALHSVECHTTDFINGIQTPQKTAKRDSKFVPVHVLNDKTKLRGLAFCRIPCYGLQHRQTKPTPPPPAETDCVKIHGNTNACYFKITINSSVKQRWAAECRHTTKATRPSVLSNGIDHHTSSCHSCA